ncbi:MAG: YeeE/YedE family protein, partial [Paracoccaceae bacterium]|nr:YeeE/YedE family protein [Paracoccaceae bacterium]
TFIGYRLVWRRNAPLFGGGFQTHNNSTIDARLVGGSAIFGIGWGIAGFCPGGAIPTFGLGHSESYIFIASLVVGILVARRINPFFLAK